MKIHSILLIGAESDFSANVLIAAKRAFPEAAVEFAPNVTQALTRPVSTGGELLLLPENETEDYGNASTALDEENLPRWAIVRFGPESGNPPAENWDIPQLIRAFQDAVRLHGLERDNARLRGDLLTMSRRVSHDLRTPLGGVIATVDMLAETIPASSGVTKPLFNSIDEITKIINRTSFLLKAIAKPPAPGRFNMGTAFKEALMRLEMPIYRKRATVSRPDNWPEVHGVESWMEIVWWNLLHNSLQHTGESPLIETGWDRTENGWRFWVRDNGPGVAPKLRNMLFRSFHLLHDPNAPRGIGLPIVRRLMDLQGGECGYEPQAEGGAGFYFTLPEH